MRNRAKCKLCLSVLESFHKNDFVACKCGEIAICGGLETLITQAKDYANFLRVDDEGNEIIVTYKGENTEEATKELHADPVKPITKKELLDMLEEFIRSDEKLPESAQMSPLTYYDLSRYMLIILEILKKGEE